MGRREEEIRRVAAELAARLDEHQAAVEDLIAALHGDSETSPEGGNLAGSGQPGDDPGC